MQRGRGRARWQKRWHEVYNRTLKAETALGHDGESAQQTARAQAEKECGRWADQEPRKVDAKKLKPDPYPPEQRGDAWEGNGEDSPAPERHSTGLFSFLWEAMDSAAFAAQDYRPAWL